jgi:magnesium-protoporphyrin O-methyltransferase
VTAIDVAQGLVDIAAERAPSYLGHGRIQWRVGDMLDPALGSFDHIVAMDSLIHYTLPDMVWALSALTRRCSGSILFTFAPYTPLLGAMHTVGKVFPRSDRSPAIVPIAKSELRAALAQFDGWKIGRSGRISSGFYKSHAMELVRI